MEEHTQQILQWFGYPEEMYDSEAFEEIELEVFAAIGVHKARYCSKDIKEEVGLNVVHADGLEVLVSPCFFDEVQEDLEYINDIKSFFDCQQLLLFWLLGRIVSIFILDLIYIREYQNKWGDEQIVDDNKSDNKVPYLARSAIFINQIPFEFALT